MRLNAEDIKKYEAHVLKSTDAALLLKKAVDRSCHCLLLQSEDSLLLDILTYIYMRAVLNTAGDSFPERLVSNNIPDIIILPQGEKVLAEDAEFIIDTAYLTPAEFDTKIYVIDRCETMTESAQNKLLKLFEEPPASCRFILKCASKFALLPTVRSRSEIIEIKPLSMDAVLDILPQSVSLRQRALIAATCFGRLDYIEKVLGDNNYLILEDLAFEVFHNMKRSSDMVKISYNILKFKDYIDIVIFYIECILHDCMVYSINERERIYFKHREKEIERLGSEYSADAALELSCAVMRARQRIKSYGNITGIIDELLFSMLEVKTKWQKL